jgi:hypothetical protein
MGEDAEDEEEDEDANDGGDAAAPPLLVPPAARPKEVIAEEDPVEMVPMQEAPVAHEVILADAEPNLPQPHIYHLLLDDDPNEGHSDMDKWFPKDGSNDRD